MKRILFFIIVSSSLTISAQNSKKDEGITFGLKGGLNVSNFIGEVNNNTFRNQGATYDRYFRVTR